MLQHCLDLVTAAALFAAVTTVFLLDETQVVPPPPMVVEPEHPPESAPPPPLPDFSPPPEFVYVEPPPEPPEVAPPADAGPPVDPVPRIMLQFADAFRVGVVTTTGNPEDPSDDGKRLTYAANGGTGNIRLSVDGITPLPGEAPASVTRSNERLADGGYESVATYNGVRLTRQIQEVPGAISRRMDTIRVTYVLANVDSGNHVAGLRVMVDSLIGGNDGVPFIVPGTDRIVTRSVTYRGNRVPDFVRALERPSLQNPGVIVDMGLRADDGVELPQEVVLTNWPGGNADWDFNRTADFSGDTAIGLYYDRRLMRSGEKRTMSYTYGLGTISSTRTRNAALSLTAGGPFRAGGQFWLVALVQNPKAGQKVALELPSGVSVGPDESLEKPVRPSDTYSQISWLLSIAPRATGEASLKAKLLPETTEETETIAIEANAARLKLIASQPVASGGAFWLTGVIPAPRDGQSVELTLPEGMQAGPDEQLRKPVALSDKGYSHLSWLVRVSPGREGSHSITARLAPDNVNESLAVDVTRPATDLKLVTTEAIRSRPFWVVALVQHPRKRQSVSLRLPPGVELAGDNTRTERVVPSDKGFVQVPFLVKSSQSGAVQFSATLTPGSLEAAVAVDIAVGSLVE